MFSFPVTIPCRNDESVFPVIVSVAIDEIAVVKPLLDNAPPFGVESTTSDLIPLTEIIFVDGRRLPVMEPPHIINHYLDAYTMLEDFYTIGHELGVEEVEEEPVKREDNVIPLFGHRNSCATLEGSIPD